MVFVLFLKCIFPFHVMKCVSDGPKRDLRDHKKRRQRGRSRRSITHNPFYCNISRISVRVFQSFISVLSTSFLVQQRSRQTKMFQIQRMLFEEEGDRLEMSRMWKRKQLTKKNLWLWTQRWLRCPKALGAFSVTST